MPDPSPTGRLSRRLVLAAPVLLAARPARAADPVDLVLALAIDVSGSVTPDEAELQRDGYRRAITDPQVLAAVTGGMLGAIGIAYFEWANRGFQDVVVPWTRIGNAADAQAWSARLGQAPYQSVYGTSISGALGFAGALLKQAPFEGTRRVIDVSGDGANNNGPPAEPVRDALVADGVTINGLPIINRHPRFGRLELDVDKYYRDSVIGGPRAFYIVAEDFSTFADAIRRKLVQEIADRTHSNSLQRG